MPVRNNYDDYSEITMDPTTKSIIKSPWDNYLNLITYMDIEVLIRIIVL